MEDRVKDLFEENRKVFSRWSYNKVERLYDEKIKGTNATKLEGSNKEKFEQMIEKLSDYYSGLYVIKGLKKMKYDEVKKMYGEIQKKATTLLGSSKEDYPEKLEEMREILSEHYSGYVTDDKVEEMYEEVIKKLFPLEGSKEELEQMREILATVYLKQTPTFAVRDVSDKQLLS